jgi:hypothetical protein
MDPPSPDGRCGHRSLPAYRLSTGNAPPITRADLGQRELSPESTAPMMTMKIFLLKI